MGELSNAVPVLAAVDYPAAVGFWRDVLGFTGTDHGDFATLGRDSVEVFIGRVDNQLIPDNTMAWLRTGDVAALHADWSARIAASPYAERCRVTPVGAQPWGQEFVVIDPAGNCVHIAERRD